MGRPRKAFPEPGKRCRNERWRVYWRDGARVNEVALGPVSEVVAEKRRLGIALALRTGDWPEWAGGSKAVMRYRRERAGATDGDGVLGEYRDVLLGQVSPGWANAHMAMIEELQEFAGGDLMSVSRRVADAFLSHVIGSRGPRFKKRGPRSRGTRNHVLKACRRFYRWAVDAGAAHDNPFDGIRTLREEDRVEIVHLTRVERAAVLAAADEEADGIAVWLALYAGMRRSEVARCAWKDINLDGKKLVVPKSKTFRRRVVDLPKVLVEKLKVIRGVGRGRVVPWPATESEWRYVSDGMLNRLCTAAERVPIEKIKWNVFRHTFASLLVQAGVSIYKVASWMGNQVGVCQRHYAAMAPDHDPDIDRL